MHKIFSLLLCDRLPVKSLIFHTFKTQIDRVVKQISKIRRCKLKFCPLLKFESIFEEMSVSARRILLKSRHASAQNRAVECLRNCMTDSLLFIDVAGGIRQLLRLTLMLAGI